MSNAQKLADLETIRTTVIHCRDALAGLSEKLSACLSDTGKWPRSSLETILWHCDMILSHTVEEQTVQFRVFEVLENQKGKKRKRKS